MDSTPIPFKQYAHMYDKAVENEDLTRDGGEFYMIQANLPRDWASYHSGNGEGIWVVIDDETRKTWNSDKADGTFYAIPCVMSVYYPQLSRKLVDTKKELLTPLEFEYRGAKRPVLVKRTLEGLIGKLKQRS